MVLRKRSEMGLSELRDKYHAEICRDLFGYRNGLPNIADENNEASVQLANAIVNQMRFSLCHQPPVGQEENRLFGLLTKRYLNEAFSLSQFNPERWTVLLPSDGAEFEQIAPCAGTAHRLAQNPDLRAAWGNYLLTPDILIGRKLLQRVGQDAVIAQNDLATSRTSDPDGVSDSSLSFYASISCKRTLRSDRSQNARAEALNLIRNRKGNQPHIVAVTAEPLPTRIASLALGTGDLDCVYHFALHELQAAIAEIDNEDQMDMLNILVKGRRLRDISDLPFDLAI